MTEMETIKSTRREDTRADMRMMTTFFNQTKASNNKENRPINKPPPTVKKLIKKKSKKPSVDVESNQQQQALQLIKSVDEKLQNPYGQPRMSFNFTAASTHLGQLGITSNNVSQRNIGVSQTHQVSTIGYHMSNQVNTSNVMSSQGHLGNTSHISMTNGRHTRTASHLN
jgi:hypothetical protein